ASRSRCPADRVVGRAREDDAITFVTEGLGAVDAGADEIALDQVPRCTAVRAEDDDSERTVARYEVAGPGRSPADRVVGPAGVGGVIIMGDRHAMPGVAQRRRAAGVSTDIVALHQVAGRTGVVQGDPINSVARDDVPGGSGRSADRVVGRLDQQTLE